ncbi:MAG TPA: hypothetical protein VFC99_20700 [Acidimicrobiia bacterium]|nr:hypothetical protein [Acidimicrobiia bacterium]
MPQRAQLLPDPEQREILMNTLSRANIASNAARARLLNEQGADARAVVKEEVARLGLPAALAGPIVKRVTAQLRGPKFSAYQALALPASLAKWPATDRVTLATAAGRRTIPVYVDPTRGDLRAPLDGHDVALVLRNGEFELVAEDGS